MLPTVEYVKLNSEFILTLSPLATKVSLTKLPIFFGEMTKDKQYEVKILLRRTHLDGGLHP